PAQRAAEALHQPEVAADRPTAGLVGEFPERVVVLEVAAGAVEMGAFGAGLEDGVAGVEGDVPEPVVTVAVVLGELAAVLVGVDVHGHADVVQVGPALGAAGAVPGGRRGG